MEKLPLLEFTKDETNSSVTKKISDRVKSVNLTDITKELNKDFVFQDETIRKIYTALSTGKNCLLHGPGGYSKTVLIKAFCELLQIPIIVKVGHKESSTEDLLGIPNMQKLMNESTLETAFENSVFSKPAVLVLEEFTDTKPSVAASLKDVITERGFRENGKLKESLVSSIIITGNTNPALIGDDDDSIKAFYQERFPIQHNVVWKDFSEEAYFKFFEVYFKDKFKEHFEKFVLLAKLCSNNKHAVSPRIAADAGDIMIDMGIAYLDTINGLDTEEIESLKKDAEITYQYQKELDLLNKIRAKIKLLQNSLYHNKVASEYLKTFVCLDALLTVLPLSVCNQNTDELIHISKLITDFQRDIIDSCPSELNFSGIVNKILKQEF